MLRDKTNIEFFLVLSFLITCRYLSSQAWSGGPYPIAIPQTLRAALQDTSDPQMGGTGAARTSNWDNNSKKELRSVFDLVGHLCGRSVPGIPLASTLPTCPVDRVRQIHWMYSTLLTFLRYVNCYSFVLHITLVTVALCSSNYLPEFCSCRLSSAVSV